MLMDPFAARFYMVPLLVLTGCILSPVCTIAQLDTQTVRFVEDVLFSTEFSQAPERFCKLWASPPRLSTFGPGRHHENVIKNVVDQLNRCLPESRQIQILAANDNNASLKVYFVAYQEFHDVANANDFSFVENNWGFFSTKWDSDYVIQSAVVLIATDKLSGTRLNHFVLEEITQSLGFPGDSKRFEKSVFYEDPSIQKFGKTTRLSVLDRRLIKFHYRHNKPGDMPVETGLTMGKKWAESQESR